MCVPPGQRALYRIGEKGLAQAVLPLVSRVLLIGFEIVPEVVADADCQEVRAVDVVGRAFAFFQKQLETQAHDPRIDAGPSFVSRVGEQLEPSRSRLEIARLSASQQQTVVVLPAVQD
jgi:hypothetical protein